ncbi:MAG TPA: STAS domain-containing protein [Pseudonocardiaceae bacterium]|nr:STAS domain-containing protein [Pseudonocardiaceae bacterium]
MDVAQRTFGDVTVVELTGELDNHTALSTREHMMPLVSCSDRLLLDLSRVTYLSSAGLRVLLLMYRQAVATGTQIALTAIPPDIYAVMSATGFLDFFAVTDTVEAGLAELTA